MPNYFITATLNTLNVQAGLPAQTFCLCAVFLLNCLVDTLGFYLTNGGFEKIHSNNNMPLHRVQSVPGEKPKAKAVCPCIASSVCKMVYTYEPKFINF